MKAPHLILLATFAGSLILPEITSAAVIALYPSESTTAYASMQGTSNVWNDVGSATPTSPSSINYSGPLFYGVFGAAFTPTSSGTFTLQNAQRYVTQTSPDYFGSSAQVPSPDEAGTSVALLAPMFEPTSAFTGTLDDVDITRRGYGASGPVEFRLIVEVGGTNLYITDPISVSFTGNDGVITVPGSGNWNVFDSSDPFLLSPLTSSAFDGSGNLTGVGVWLTETVTYAGGGTSSNMAGFGISSLQFNGTAVPEPATLGMLALGLGLTLLLRHRRGFAA